MATSVHVISEEIIKPSSQTPHHLKSLRLSLLDQLVPPVYIPLIFFYQADELNGCKSSSIDSTDRSHISQKLKQSLSQTLISFYPLAGKLDQENFTVDCNDAGVKYVEARVNGRIIDIVQEHTAEKLKHFLPVSSTVLNFGTDNDVFLAVQINFFDCGGIAIGVCLSHYIGDGVSAATFVNSWAATCRGVQIPRPSFDLAGYFPSARDLSGTNISMSTLLAPDREILVTKRFVFDKLKLAALRKHATSSSGSNAVKDPTRVELVSAFIWKHLIQISKSKKSNTRTAAGTQAVNLRKRIDPSHGLETCFGNCVMIQVAMVDQDNGIPNYHDLIFEFRNKIRAVNNEYIQKSRSEAEEEGYVGDLKKSFELLLKGELEVCGFTSWCRFPMYEVDYGWGRPVWVGTTAFPMMNFTVLMDTKSGDGVEAWISTLQENIESLESHFQLLSEETVDIPQFPQMHNLDQVQCNIFGKLSI